MFNLLADPDLDASVEMIAFMWIATGNDPARVTPETLSLVRLLLAQNFAQLPLELQTLFANGRVNSRVIQTAWSAAAPIVKIGMAQQFGQVLAVLGLVPSAVGTVSGGVQDGGNSLNADIASNIAWNLSGAGDWSKR